MAQPIMEQCLLTLTEILNSQNNAVRNIRVTIEKRLKYVENFTGKQGTLPSFIATIDQIIEEFGPVNINEVFAVVYNEKIGGIAKNFLAIEAPASWEECKQKLKIHFRPTKDEATILRSINSIKVIMLLVLLVTQTTHGILQTTLINEQTGYLKIKIKDLEITNQTNTILHIIDPEEILNTITLIQTNIKHLQIENKDMIFKEIETIIAKIKSITPKEQRRFRRGLINVVGNVERWLFGTMDNEDREQIWNYLRISEENSHNAIDENSYSNRGGVTYDIAATTMQPISAASAMKGQQHDQPKSAASANNGQQHFQPISAASAIKGQQLNHPLNAMSALKEYKSKVITDQRSPIIRM
ncbi:uncharacterized protein LOC129941432 [Eupeodes corollae]|uniref:uncharacterized protein LOC129941432 n=1 Tax=Eupeodes corollae TaxID=290404 RepID=UPI002490668C|nr:uncharacterized protein LOC129941432 [Eupeodes corollae]